MTKYKRERTMTWITWIANTGGLMGLCMGLSFVSVAEILYYLARLCAGCFGIGKDKEEELVEELARKDTQSAKVRGARWRSFGSEQVSKSLNICR